jgi:predicted RNase H-like HicB family nuclease
LGFPLLCPPDQSTSAKIDRPFDRENLRAARELASQYQVVVWSEDGEYYGRGVELPGVMADGKTPAECLEATREALTYAVAAVRETGQTPPLAWEGQRNARHQN